MNKSEKKLPTSEAFVSPLKGLSSEIYDRYNLFNKIKILPVSRSRTKNPRTEQAKNAQIR
jgi:hypothetical protein